MQIHKYKYTNTNAQKVTNAQIQILTYKCTQIQNGQLLAVVLGYMWPVMKPCVSSSLAVTTCV